jgi:YD repeat-containing protein
VDQTIDPNTIQVTTQYLGLTRQVTLGVAPAQPQVTLYTSDAAGRLAQVTDATGHVTNYFFDGGNRINQVQQMGDGGLAQYRTWAYNRLGWLTSLTQPESGITTYSTPTVAGKPTVTSYNGRNVSMTPDWMGRPTAILSSSSGDTSVAQSFIYDTAMGGMGKLASSTDGGITTSFTYGAAGGRLDSLTTTLLIQGAPQSFTQTFTYDNYGNRSSGSTSHNTWTQAYIPETGMPSLLSYGSTGMVASTPWESWDSTGWMLKKISYGNGVKTTFDYDADQTRLNLIIHSPASGGPFAQWCYNYNSLGNLYQVDNLVTGSFDLYGYDNLNRLVSALVESPTYGDQQQQFTYDAFGNRTSSAIMGVAGWSGARGARDSLPTFTTSALQSDPNRHVVNAAFNPSDTALKNQLPAQTSVGVLTGSAYDAQGNQTQVYLTPGDTTTQVTMLYDALGRVVSLGNTKANQVERYQYTTEGLRTVVEVYQGSIAPQNLLKIQYRIYNDIRQLVSEHELVLE